MFKCEIRRSQWFTDIKTDENFGLAVHYAKAIKIPIPPFPGLVVDDIDGHSSYVDRVIFDLLSGKVLLYCEDDSNMNGSLCDALEEIGRWTKCGWSFTHDPHDFPLTPAPPER